MEQSNAKKVKEYTCKHISIEKFKSLPRNEAWSDIPSLELVENVSGEPCIENTIVRGCWSSEFIIFQFICKDKLVISDFTKRDEPLYEQDVIEVFIDEEGLGLQYLELEVSPKNVIFDAKISNDGHGKITGTDLAWDCEGLHTEVYNPEPDVFIYYIYIPSINFSKPLVSGKKMTANFYRIDGQSNGERIFQAWSPTGAINFHLSQQFGNLILE